MATIWLCILCLPIATIFSRGSISLWPEAFRAGGEDNPGNSYIPTGTVVSNLELACHSRGQKIGFNICKNSGYSCNGNRPYDPYVFVCENGFILESYNDVAICRKKEVAKSCKEISELLDSFNPISNREGFEKSENPRIPTIFTLQRKELPCTPESMGIYIGADRCLKTGYTCHGSLPIYMECSEGYVFESGIANDPVCTPRESSRSCIEVSMKVKQKYSNDGKARNITSNMNSINTETQFSNRTRSDETTNPNMSILSKPWRIIMENDCDGTTNRQIGACSSSAFECENNQLVFYFCPNSDVIQLEESFGPYCKHPRYVQSCHDFVCN
uniref:Chitin-binding type-2 domain-containing protein n=1 Tax=Acrobeloides nanus TaxID=290746 RepID=A0A914E9D4_9BILA